MEYLSKKHKEPENKSTLKDFKSDFKEQPISQTINWRNAMLVGLLLAKIEYWKKQYEFSFQFWEEDNNTGWIYRGGVELTCFGGRDSIIDVLEEAVAWCEKANPRYKYPNDVVATNIDLPE